MAQAFKISERKVFPALLGFHPLLPLFGQREIREHRQRAGILYGVDEHAALRKRAETVLILAGQLHVVWV